MYKPNKNEIFDAIQKLEKMKSNSLKIRKYNQNDFISYRQQIDLLTKALKCNNIDSWDFMREDHELFRCAFWLEKGNIESDYFYNL